jgi:hypothetical protein
MAFQRGARRTWSEALSVGGSVGVWGNVPGSCVVVVTGRVVVLVAGEVLVVVFDEIDPGFEKSDEIPTAMTITTTRAIPATKRRRRRKTSGDGLACSAIVV